MILTFAVDLRTMYLASVLSALIISVVIALISLQNRQFPCLRWWAVAYGLGAVGATLIIERGNIPGSLSIGIGNALIVLTHGLLWVGARVFDERPPAFQWVLLSVAIWLAACLFPSFMDYPPARITLGSGIIAFWTGMTAIELWRGRSETLASRLATIGFCTIHAVTFATFGALGAFSWDGGDPILQSGLWFRISGVESFLFAIASGMTLVALTKERAERLQYAAASTDALTGILNRRAFFVEGDRFLQESAEALQAVSMVVFDLDRFKSVNDRFGHAAGDLLLTTFAETAVGLMRDSDIFGRIGGEEFAALIAGDSDVATTIAERISSGFRERHVETIYGRVGTTLSAGVSERREGEVLAALMARADRALYRAKRNGRDRVERNSA